MNNDPVNWRDLWGLIYFPANMIGELGTNVGTLGNTGKSSGAHVDLRIADPKGNLVDPITILPQRPSSIKVESTVIENPETGRLTNKLPPKKEN